MTTYSDLTRGIPMEDKQQQQQQQQTNTGKSPADSSTVSGKTWQRGRKPKVNSSARASVSGSSGRRSPRYSIPEGENFSSPDMGRISLKENSLQKRTEARGEVETPSLHVPGVLPSSGVLVPPKLSVLKLTPSFSQTKDESSDGQSQGSSVTANSGRVKDRLIDTNMGRGKAGVSGADQGHTMTTGSEGSGSAMGGKPKLTPNQSAHKRAKKRKKRSLQGGPLPVPKGTGDDHQKKRNRSDGSSPAESKTTKRPRHGPSVLSYAGAVKGQQELAIVDARYPEVLLTEEQVRSIDEAIVNLVMEQDPDLPVPKFKGRELAHGTLMVTCCEVADCEWLVRNIGLLSLPGGVSLKALKPDELPRRALVRLYVKSEKDPKDILRILGRFNPSLHVNSWFLKEHRKEAGKGETLLLVAVPKDEELALVALSCRPHFGLGTAKAKIAESSEREAAKPPVPPVVDGTEGRTETAPTVEVPPGKEVGVRPNVEASANLGKEDVTLATAPGASEEAKGRVLGDPVMEVEESEI